MSEEKYVWIVTGYHDIPTAERYTLIEQVPSGVRVNCRGTKKIIRKAHGTRFFFAREELDTYYSHCVASAWLVHQRSAQSCKEASACEIVIGIVPDKPFSGQIRLK